MNPNQNTRSHWANFFAIAFVVLFCVGWFVRYEWQMLAGQYWHNDDNAQHVAWLWKWRPDNQFAENDMMNAAAEQLQPWGYVALGRAAMLVMDPIQFGKYMPLATLLTACLFAFFLVKKRYGRPLGMAAAVLVGFLCIERMVGFNARAFGYPLLLAFLYFFCYEKWRGVATCLIVSALLYPVSLMIEAGLLGFEAARWTFFHRKNLIQSLKTNSKTILPVAFGFVFALAITFVKSRQIANAPNLGPMFSKKELLTLPMFQPEGGRVNFLEEMKPISVVFHNAFPDIEYAWPLLIVALLLLLANMSRSEPHDMFDRAIFYLPAAAISMFLMARWLLPTLFLPGRYLTYTYPVFFSVLLVRLLGIHADFFKKWWAAALLLAALGVPKLINFEAKNNSQIDYGNYSTLFLKISELPHDNGLIAAPLMASDMLPLHCNRSVLFSYEGFHALYFKLYWEKMSRRYYDYIDAVTSPDPAEVEAFVRKYDVAYLVVDVGFSVRKWKMWAFAPFQEYITKRVEANPRYNFAANQLPVEFYTDVEQDFRILDCKKWLRK